MGIKIIILALNILIINCFKDLFQEELKILKANKIKNNVNKINILKRKIINKMLWIIRIVKLLVGY